ncbi:TetR/AcrR family transcriptional regulator [Zhenpiania hominis]|uniref:TetR family transcriptional regulator n=1 Tax=Zhenpiania hominis TaxID=2763644 RepID=A0A923NI61_9FIRM|nr:TetR family transcriptional regulator [Zhenpiania hominis]MBC6678532.1 TetR family transcriptional regulator [Zhenpiania hominis]
MPIDMKQYIADAAERLIEEKRAKKLTVTDIVEECAITRQTFYYHFEDIPDLINWMLKQEFEKATREINRSGGNLEYAMRRFLETAMSKEVVMKRVLATNYGDVIRQLLIQNMRAYLLQLIEEKRLFADATRLELKVIVNYYVYAIAGVLNEWDSLKTEDIDKVAHQIYLLVTGKQYLSE